MHRRLAATVAALALVACGGGDEEIDTEADQERNDAAIEALVEELEDDGYVLRDDDGDDNELEFDSDDCSEFAEGFDAADEEPSVEAESGQLSTGDLEAEGGETTVAAETALVEEEDVAAGVFELYADDGIGDCIIEAFETSFAESGAGIEAEGLEFEELDAPSVGEESFAFAVEGELLAQSFSFPFRSAIFLARDGRAVAQVTITDIGESAPGEDADDLVELLMDELVAEG